jgi:hypothetical protein
LVSSGLIAPPASGAAGCSAAGLGFIAKKPASVTIQVQPESRGDVALPDRRNFRFVPHDPRGQHHARAFGKLTGEFPRRVPVMPDGVSEKNASAQNSQAPTIEARRKSPSAPQPTSASVHPDSTAQRSAGQIPRTARKASPTNG